MRTIRYIVNMRIPTEKAHGSQVMKTCEALAENRPVELVVPRRVNFLSGDPFAFYGVRENFKIIKVWCLDLMPLDFLGGAAFWLESLTFNVSAFFYTLFRRYDIFYTRDFLTAFLFSMVHRNLFYEIHTMPKSGLLWHTLAWRRSRGLIVITNGLKNDLLAHGISAGTIVIARDAVDVEKFNIRMSKEDCRKELNLPLEQKIVLYTGHLYEWKGAGTLARAAGELPADIHVHLVGGTKKDEKDFRDNYHYPNLHIIGWRDPATMPVWLKAADLLVLPTSGKEKIGEKYTSPMKLFEYMASGRPILASDLPSIREVLNDDEASFFVPDDPADLARKISEIFQNFPVFENKAKVALDRSKEHTWEKRAETILNFLDGQDISQ